MTDQGVPGLVYNDETGEWEPATEDRLDELIALAREGQAMLWDGNYWRVRNKDGATWDRARP